MLLVSLALLFAIITVPSLVNGRRLSDEDAEPYPESPVAEPEPDYYEDDFLNSLENPTEKTLEKKSCSTASCALRMGGG